MAKFQTLVDIYHDAVKTFPDSPLFGTKRAGQWEWMTYLEFGKQTDALRAGLAGLGLKSGDRVAIIANNRPEWATAAYACFGLGAAFVPMYEAQLAKDWEFIVKDCGAKALIVATDAICEKTKPFLASISGLTHIISLDPATEETDQVRTYKALIATTSKTPTIKPDVKDVACFICTKPGLVEICFCTAP